MSEVLGAVATFANVTGSVMVAGRRVPAAHRRPLPAVVHVAVVLTSAAACRRDSKTLVGAEDSPGARVQLPVLAEGETLGIWTVLAEERE